MSLVFWVLALIVSTKYVGFVLRADNRGEGGVLALMSLAIPETRRPRPHGVRRWVSLAGVFGAALLYGDGIITPAVSILSAVEVADLAAGSVAAGAPFLGAFAGVAIWLAQRR